MNHAEKIFVRYFSIFLLIMFFNTGMINQTWGKSTDIPYVEDELLVRFHAGVSRVKSDEILKGHSAAITGEIQQIRMKRIKVPTNAVDVVKEALSKNPHIEFVEHNFLAQGSVVPNDSYYLSQWHLPKISAPFGWDISTGSGTVPIAIIDSGVDPAHHDLSGKLLPGYNFVSDNTDTHDVLGHGTAVAGASAALSNNYVGVAGVAWKNPVMPLVVLSSNNYASYYDIAQAITYAVDRCVRVMNISIAGSSSSYTLQNAVDYAWNKGAIIFAAAANYSTSTPYYPAACNHVIAVSATDSNDNRASFSNYGEWVDISAPGVSIYTTANGGGYRSASGTSFSSPIAAGLAALILSVNPSLTNSEVEAIIEQNADDLGSLGFDPYFGFGRINVDRSLVAAVSIAPQPDSTPPSVSIVSPSDGSIVSGVVTVSVSAADDTSVAKVELYINGNLFSSDSSEPYTFFWDTSKYADGSYDLVAIAYDSSGNAGQSGHITVYVKNQNDTVVPSVTITSPTDGSIISSKVRVSVVAKDNFGVSKIELYIDGKLVAVTNLSTLTWNWNTRKVSNGQHIILAKAYDASGNVGQQMITVYK